MSARREPGKEAPRGGGIGMIFKRRTTMVLSALAALLGIVAVVVRVSSGDGPLSSGVFLGAMLFLVGAMRLWLAASMPGDSQEEKDER